MKAKHGGKRAGAGRKQAGEHKRDCTIAFRVTALEHAAAAQCAKGCDVTLSSLARDSMLAIMRQTGWV